MDNSEDEIQALKKKIRELEKRLTMLEKETKRPLPPVVGHSANGVFIPAVEE